jgi:PIN domain nuclease of toxin-antitoxin system
MRDQDQVQIDVHDQVQDQARQNSDPADRIIAATARAHGLSLVTKDQRLQDSRLVQTIW